MAYEQKTKPTDLNVIQYLEQVDPKKREDASRLLDLFSETTGHDPVMWGPSIIGFGTYHYKYASGHEGDAPLVGFSPRKSKFSLYFAAGDPSREKLLAQLGKYTAGKSCVYINKLADVDIAVLRLLIEQSIAFIGKTYPND